MNSTFKFLLFCFFSLSMSCTDDAEGPKLVLPSGLQVSITLSDDVDGLMEVIATAQNSNYYSLYVEDGEETAKEERNDGKFSYVFNNSGNHLVRVRAHATATDYIEYTQTVTIELEGGTDSAGIPTTGYSTPLSYSGYTLIWQDEFDGNRLNLEDWNYEVGTGQNGWGNNELQYYLQDNTSVGHGVLTIEARKEIAGNSSYTSSRITTQGKRSFKYGRVDIRAALPQGKGMWPALWMLGESISSVGWPRCGEIDIMEMVGGSSGEYSDSRVHGTAHWADQNGQRALFGGYKDLSNGKFADEFHVFSIIWDSQRIQWFLDDQKYHELDITAVTLSELRNEFFFIFNVAVGGDWPGPPNATTQFPQRMYVDYIRVFQKS